MCIAIVYQAQQCVDLHYRINHCVVEVNQFALRWHGGATVRTLDLCHRFDSRSGHYQVVTTRMGDCLRTGKPSQYITNH